MSEDIPLVFTRDVNDETVRRELLAYIKHKPGSHLSDFVFANRIALGQAWRVMEQLVEEGKISAA